MSAQLWLAGSFATIVVASRVSVVMRGWFDRDDRRYAGARRSAEDRRYAWDRRWRRRSIGVQAAFAYIILVTGCGRLGFDAADEATEDAMSLPYVSVDAADEATEDASSAPHVIARPRHAPDVLARVLRRVRICDL